MTTEMTLRSMPRKFGGPLSWGICRQDVRNRLPHGDLVVFFSFRKFKETGD